jgi:hypothetical protein
VRACVRACARLDICTKNYSLSVLLIESVFITSSLACSYHYNNSSNIHDENEIASAWFSLIYFFGHRLFKLIGLHSMRIVKMN